MVRGGEFCELTKIFFVVEIKKQQENVECSQHAILPGEILGCFRRQWVVDLL